VRGRRTGEPPTTVWFVAEPGRILLAGRKESPQWCRNLRADGSITVQIGRRRFAGAAVVDDDPVAAGAIRDRFVRKYTARALSRAPSAATGARWRSVTLDPAPEARSA
jgi:hypothetical protein